MERSPWNRILATDAPGWVILIRLMVGAVCLSEGVQKFLYPAEVGAGRFAKIGLPAPDYSMLLGSLFLLIVGGGAWSLDSSLRKRSTEEP